MTKSYQKLVIGNSKIPFPYKATVLRQHGTPSHFLTALFMILSNFSTSEIATSYTVKGHLTRGKSPNCKHHNFSLPGNLINGNDILNDEFSKLCNLSSVTQRGTVPSPLTLNQFLYNNRNHLYQQCKISLRPVLPLLIIAHFVIQLGLQPTGRPTWSRCYKRNRVIHVSSDRR